MKRHIPPRYHVRKFEMSLAKSNVGKRPANSSKSYSRPIEDGRMEQQPTAYKKKVDISELQLR